MFLGRKAMTNLDSILKSREIANKSPSSQSYGFPSSSSVWVWELDYKESWAPKNWCFWIVVLEKTLESPLDCKEIQSIHPKGNQSWIFIGRTDAEAEIPILWPPDAKKWFIWKDPDAGKDWGQEEKGTTEDEMVGWHPQRNGHEFEQALRIHDGQGNLACCSPWGRKESDTTVRLNWSELSHGSVFYLWVCFPQSYQFSSVQSLSRVRLFATPWIAARQASLSITISRSSLRLTLTNSDI